MPACSNEWVNFVCDKKKYTCSKCPNHSFIEINDRVIYNHLKGDERISLFLDKDFVEKMDKEIKSAGFKSRNDFVVYAVNSYFADKLLSDDNEKLAKEIAMASEEQQKRISKGLFRYAVELELIMKILAEEKHFSKDRLEEMRKEAINNVRRTRGKVRLDDLFERKDYKSL